MNPTPSNPLEGPREQPRGSSLSVADVVDRMRREASRPGCNGLVASALLDYAAMLDQVIAEQAFQAMVDVSQQLGLYEATADPVVCVTHSRFVPCRKQDGRCVLSSEPADVEQVRVKQVP